MCLELLGSGRMARLATLLVLVSGCDDPFSPYARLEKLRVLAIAAEPPRPGPTESATLTPLLYAPAEAAATLAWSWCPLVGAAEDGYPCLVEESAFRAQIPGWPPFALGDGPIATFAHTVAPEHLRGLCAGSPAGATAPVLPDCEAGFPIVVRLEARTGADRVVAFFFMNLRFEEGHTHLANQNPVIEQLLLGTPEERLPLDGARIPAFAAAETPVALAVSETSVENYLAPDERGELVGRREQLTFSWFVEAGEPRFPRTGFIDGVVPLGRAIENRWKFPEPPDPGLVRARMVVVVRDDRGGVSWRSATAELDRGDATP